MTLEEAKAALLARWAAKPYDANDPSRSRSVRDYEKYDENLRIAMIKKPLLGTI